MKYFIYLILHIVAYFTYINILCYYMEKNWNSKI